MASVKNTLHWSQRLNEWPTAIDLGLSNYEYRSQMLCMITSFVSVKW